MIFQHITEFLSLKNGSDGQAYGNILMWGTYYCDSEFRPWLLQWTGFWSPPFRHEGSTDFECVRCKLLFSRCHGKKSRLVSAIQSMEKNWEISLYNTTLNISKVYLSWFHLVVILFWKSVIILGPCNYVLRHLMMQICLW